MRKIIILLFGAFTHLSSAQVSSSELTQQWVINYFQTHYKDLGLNEQDASMARISDFYADNDGRIYHAYLQQYINGVPLLNGIFGMHFNSTGQLLYKTNSFSQLSTSTQKFNVDALNSNIVDMASKAAGVDISINVKRIDISQKTEFSEKEQYYYPCYFAASVNEQPVPAFNIIAYNPETADWWNVLISPEAVILDKINWTSTCTKAKSENVLERRSADMGEYKAFYYPVESPLYGNVRTLSLPSDSLASPFGWHDIDGVRGHEYNYTRGNNVFATEDRNADNSPGYYPTGDSLLRFNFPYSPSEKDPANYLSFAISNLFVANNLMHDISYRYGFDEPAGNFQVKNYSGKGAGNDGVNADAQDGSGTNNANFATPPDGSAPRMQMYVWDATSASGPTLKINSPVNDKYIVGTAQFGKKLTTVPITEGLVLVNDGTGDPAKGCNALRNASLLKGKIAAIQRGTCTFTKKVYNAQLAGAIAVVILDSSASNQVITMSGTDSRITIPAVMAKTTDGKTLYQLMQSGTVNVTLVDSSGSAPKTDSDLDMLVIAHEYTHGISTRLTCGPSISTGLSNAEQMGEGWSDYMGLALTQRKEDFGATPRGVGNWLLGQDSSGSGIRNYQYSTNMAVNPLTYQAVADASTNGRAPVHFVGEVWCTMLWDMHWKLIEKYGYDPNLYSGSGGNNISLKLVMDGLKLQKCNPGFIDGRNAILKADSIYNGGQNAKLIWEAFARRGLGFSARQGASTSTSDGLEAFDIPKIYSGSSSYTTSGKPQLRLWPNPAGKNVLLEPTNVNTMSNVMVFDLTGRLQNVTYSVNQDGVVSLDLQNLGQGMYLIQCKTEKGFWSSRFLKSH